MRCTSKNSCPTSLPSVILCFSVFPWHITFQCHFFVSFRVPLASVFAEICKEPLCNELHCITNRISLLSWDHVEEGKKYEILHKAADVDESQGRNPLGNSGHGYSWATPGKSLANYLIKTKHKKTPGVPVYLPEKTDPKPHSAIAQMS